MSLLVWLPMTKDLTQQGLSDITISNVGATLDNNGKLGKCYYFDGNAHYLQFSESVGDLYSGDFSYAVWLKPMDDTRSVICSEYASSGSSNIAFELSASRQVRLYWNGSPDISSTGCILPKSQWTHIAITRSGNEAKFYMNGELKYTYTGTLSNRTSTAKIRLGDDYRGGTGVTYMGYMNDFRLYDHALSPKEVELLSRGLVCHYPLNNNGGGQSNLLKNSNFTEGSNGLRGYTSSATSCVKQTDCVKIVSGSASSGIYTGNYDSVTTGVMVTFSAYVKADTDMTVYIGVDGGGIGNCQAYTVGNSWQRISISKAKTTNNANLRLYGKGTFYVKLLKYELGDKTTPWQPHSTDSTYSSLSYDSTTEYDVSGYGYNGTKSKTMLYTSNTARYSVATIFDGNTDSIKIPFNDMLGLTSSIKTNYTISVWTYKSVIGGRSYQTILGGQSGFELEARNSTNANPVFKLYSWGGGETPYEFNKWYHVCFVHTTTDSKLYINGELKITGTSVAVPIGSFYIGSWKVTNSQNFEGKMSDFRIYATALSANNVKELYNTAVSLANNGTLLGYELVEV